MSEKDKQIALIEAYIEVCQKDGYDDTQIIEALTDIYSQSELEDLGFEEFIADYFKAMEVFKWECRSCTHSWYVDVDGADPEWCPYCGAEVSSNFDKTTRLYSLELE